MFNCPDEPVGRGGLTAGVTLGTRHQTVDGLVLLRHHRPLKMRTENVHLEELRTLHELSVPE